MKSIILYYNKIKIVSLSVIFLFLSAGVAYTLYDDYRNHASINFYRIIVALGVLVFLSIAIYYFQFIFRSKAVMTINKDGIIFENKLYTFNEIRNFTFENDAGVGNVYFFGPDFYHRDLVISFHDRDQENVVFHSTTINLKEDKVTNFLKQNNVEVITIPKESNLKKYLHFGLILIAIFGGMIAILLIIGKIFY